ncbi:MAG: hypothetical protein JXB45_12020 [Candidatus Krumholzibacteriota bacterium]|nr:hypothetical protein [Candidatus Krumholzibacteriota bacterium]
MKKIVVLAVLLLTAGCSTYTSRMEVSRDLYYEGQYQEALLSVNKLVKDASDNDIYLYLLERGKIRLAYGDYDSAIVDLQEAERRFHEIEKTYSVGEFMKSSLISAEKIEYQPESHEKILINAYLLLAYWLEGDVEGSYVERNRVNNRLQQYTDQLSQADWEKLDVPFARYLVALLYEMEGLNDDARIEYDLIRKLRPEAAPPEANSNLTEIAVFTEFGRAPVKVSREIRGYFDKKDGKLFAVFLVPGIPQPLIFDAGGAGGLDLTDPGVIFTFAYPEYQRQPRQVEYCAIVIDNVEASRTVPLDNVEETAMAAFKKKQGSILFKAALRTALKTSAQTKLADKGGAVVDILGKVLSAVERADTRSWQTLPAEIQVFRMECEPGPHAVYVRYYGEGGRLLGTSPSCRFKVEKGKKVILYFPGPS